MKISNKSVWIAVLLMSCLIASQMKTYAQGSLTPPGAPSSVMKTLDQIQPRTPISSVPYTITEPGSYYLTGNLTSTNHGIIIQANNVTLDLMGFTLAGDRGADEYGVFLDGSGTTPIRNVVVRNGNVQNFGNGIRVECARNSSFRHLLVAGNFSYGFFLYGESGQCNGNVIVDCSISENFSAGVFLYGESGECNGNAITRCALRGNGYGVQVSCNNTGQSNGNTITDCTAIENGYGIYLNGASGQCNGNKIKDCNINASTAYGITLNSGGQCEGNAIVGCTLRKNGTNGIYLYSSIGNTVKGNHVSGTTGTTSYGIRCVSTSGNLIVCNTCVGQDNNFALGANDTFGPVVTASGALSGTDPWANFSR